MKYNIATHIINILFIGMFVTIPVLYCLKSISISDETVGYVLVFTYFFGVIIFADWYYLYLSNTYKSIMFYFLLGSFISAICLFSVALLDKKPIIELLSLRVEAWEGSRFFLKFFFVGAGISISAIYSIPRLFFIKLFINDSLPGDD